ncbi:hypothetical protein AJ78_08318, partial [Emergomyces pasteurianus Ep9510]
GALIVYFAYQLNHTVARMRKINILSQLIWFGLASAQVIKLPLMRRINDLDDEFAAALSAAQKYTLTL